MTRFTLEEKRKLVLSGLTLAGHNKQCTEEQAKDAIRNELDLWRGDRVKDFFNYMVAKEDFVLVKAGLYKVVRD